MKKITFAIGSLYGGGAERVVSIWSGLLAKKGYNVSVINYYRVENEYLIDENVQVYTIAESKDTCKAMSAFSRIKRMRRIFCEIRPDIVISFLPEMQIYVSLATLGLNIRRIETVRNNPWIDTRKNIVFQLLWKRCYKNGHAILLQTEEQAGFFKDYIQNKCVVIPNPVDSLCFEYSKTSYVVQKHQLIAVGRLFEQKNYKMMIDAVKIVSSKYNDVSLHIYGIGPMEQELRNYVACEKMQDHVYFMGRSNNIMEKLAQSDVYLLSSNYEGMPNALMEALAVGVPAISTNCKTGPKDLIVNGQNGYLVDIGDSIDMAQKIIFLFEASENSLKKMGGLAQIKIREMCSEENCLARLIDVIERV